MVTSTEPAGVYLPAKLKSVAVCPTATEPAGVNEALTPEIVCPATVPVALSL